MRIKDKICPMVLLLLLFLSGCASAASDGTEFVLTAETETEDPPEDAGDAREEQQVAETQPADIMVHVCGAVNRAGVYSLPEGSRVCQAVEAAGGFADDADEAWVNQAQVLADGVRLRIPTTEETLQMQGGAGDAAAAEAALTGGAQIRGSDPAAAGESGKVNINTADTDALCTLNGIGRSMAARIIAYREEHGGFSRIEDIMQVSGIKEKLFAKIRDDITV